MTSEPTDYSPHIVHPTRKVPRDLVAPILYLADRMSNSGLNETPRASRTVDKLADALGQPTFRVQPWFRNLTEAGAIAQLNTENARQAALVVLSLILKTAKGSRGAERAYFSYVREQLGAPPITVPADLNAHKRLALRYFRR